MMLAKHTVWYEKWAPVIGRVLFGGLFLMGAAFKIPTTQGFLMESAMTAGAGVPYAHIAVFLAFILEVVAGVSLIIGWHARAAAFVLAIFTFALALIFFTNFSNPMIIGEFVSHLGLVAGLLYISVYGAQYAAVSKDALPNI